MGFRCPNCNKDFGFDKEAFDKHLNEENGECNAIAYISLHQIDLMTGKKKQRQNKPEPKARRTYSFIDSKHHFVKTNIVSNEDGSDNVECSFCGLKAKRYMNKFKFDNRVSYKRIEKCGG